MVKRIVGADTAQDPEGKMVKGIPDQSVCVCVCFGAANPEGVNRGKWSNRRKGQTVEMVKP
jgi:hypothetical protein